MNRRTTYIVADADPDPFARITAASKDSIEVGGLPAHKHLRLRWPDAKAASALRAPVSIEWGARRDLRLPFDPPPQLGLYIVAGLDADVQALRNWVGATFGAGAAEAIGEPIVADDWLSWALNLSVSDPAQFQGALGTEFAGAYAVRASLDPDTAQVIAEAWFPRRAWTETLSVQVQRQHAGEPNGQVLKSEVGIFSVRARSPGDYLLNGRVRKLGQDDASEPVFTHWYPKHRVSSGTAAASIAEPYGLHPSLQLSVEGDAPSAGTTEPGLGSCRLYAQLYLPEDMFMDEYELNDLPRLTPPSSLIALWGENDLEKPVWASEGTGALALVRLDDGAGNYSIPLHFRYQPSSPTLESRGMLAEPYVFWACKDAEMPRRRKEFIEARELIGLDSVFPIEDSVFYVLPSNVVPYRIPAIGTGHEEFVGHTTLVVVVAGALFVAAAILLRVFRIQKTQKLKTE